MQKKLIEGKILKRYKRFLADVELSDGSIITAHVPNTGSMKTCWEPDWKVALSHHDRADRKLKYTLEMTFNGTCWIGVNTSFTNHLVELALQDKLIPELSKYPKWKREYKLSPSTRIDFLLSDDQDNQLALEVKNVTLAQTQNQLALFPDAVTSRGLKHLEELIHFKKTSGQAALVLAIQRSDVNAFAPAADIDPKYAEAFKAAYDCGVEILPYQWQVSPKKHIMIGKVPINWDTHGGAL